MRRPCSACYITMEPGVSPETTMLYLRMRLNTQAFNVDNDAMLVTPC